MPEEKKVEETPEEVPKVTDDYRLVEVPTGSAPAIKSPDGRILSTEFALVEVLNILHKIEKQVS